MTQQELLLRFGLFCGLIAAVYATAAVLFIGEIRQRRAGKTIPPGWQRFRKIVYAAALFGIMCMAYGYFVEPLWLEVKHVHLTSPKLEGATRPIKLVLISDLHCDTRHLREEDLPEIIKSEHPDCVFFTGDCANKAEEIPRFRNIIRSIAAIAPTFGVRGNWDVAQWSNYDIFFDTNATGLKGTCTELEVAGKKLAIAGLSMYSEDEVNSAVKEMPPDMYRIFLYHSPDLAYQLANKKIDLYCAGHTHGGQVALPFIGAIIVFGELGKKYQSGLYQVGDMNLYVTRGIGVDGWGPRVRFCARPEVTVLELGPAANSDRI